MIGAFAAAYAIARAYRDRRATRRHLAFLRLMRGFAERFARDVDDELVNGHPPSFARGGRVAPGSYYTGAGELVGIPVIRWEFREPEPGPPEPPRPPLHRPVS